MTGNVFGDDANLEEPEVNLPSTSKNQFELVMDHMVKRIKASLQFSTTGVNSNFHVFSKNDCISPDFVFLFS